MKCLLVAVNAKYIHSNPAVYSLKKYALGCGVDIEIAEYTINNLEEKVVQDIYLRKPDVLAISCYIWNIEFVEKVINDISKLMPQSDIWLGGPEASFECIDTLKRFQTVKGIMAGEGEETFSALMREYAKSPLKVSDERLAGIRGVVYRGEDGEIHTNPAALMPDMNRLPFIYDDSVDFTNRIIYYESSRGCPFNCSYCLSSIDKRIRFRDIVLVKSELKYFLDKKVPQVKFIDRTFNADKKRAFDIWSFILENDNKITNFHFEISADLLNDEQLMLLSQMRPGLVQLEAGIQSTNERTLHEINRYADFNALAENIRRIVSFKNIHCHVDLIAGLPYEDLESFKRSFNDVYALKANQLQLGFLKVLKGSLMYERATEYGMVYRSSAPYEVLKTKWLSYDDILLLKGVEEMVEVYYNSGQFVFIMECLERYFENAFDLFEKLAQFYKEENGFDSKQSRQARYEFIQKFTKTYISKDVDALNTVLICDYYSRENARVRPIFAGAEPECRTEISDMYADKLQAICGDDRYINVPHRRLINETHVEPTGFDLMKFVKNSEYIEGTHYVLFDYGKRSPLDSNAEITVSKSL
ncbi:MAG: B12-binding domain-containing radical SAM protein [Lachnospiraceae bacterium]|nr:B12-binding domain-containing radical SAM protein [Lachnospiraceae bacterium]